MRTYNKALTIVLTVILCSCNSYLDLKPHGKTIPKTADEYSAMIHQMINDVELEKDSYIMSNTNDIITCEAISDNLDANIYLGQEMIPYYVGQRINTPLYSKIYQNIRNCNIVLDGLKNNETELGRKVKSASYAIRGVCYMELLKYYCKSLENGVFPEHGMPIVNQFDMEARPIRSSYAETVRFIESDFANSLQYKMEDKLFMFTTDVVKSYLARLYLWTAQWEKASAISGELLGKYPILNREEYAQMVLGTKAFSNMILRYKASLQQGNYVSDRVYISLKNRPVSKNFITVFDNADKDIRYTESINRYRNPIKLFIGSIRSEEMLLICAESNYYLNNRGEALRLMNLLRSKRISNYANLTESTIPVIPNKSPIVKDAMGNALTPLSMLIINERRKELFMEGDRFMELKRLGSPEFWVSRNGLAYTTKKFMYTYPIPPEDIELNKGIVQNEGYTEFINK